MGAGILPTTIYNNKLYFLFGKENKFADTPGWSDFGGGTEKNESYLQTAVREGGEELTGFLGTDEELAKKLKKHGTYNINNYGKYRMHIFSMKYDPALPHYYNNNQIFIQRRLDPEIIRKSKIFEKAEIRWFSIDELQPRRSEFRSYFQKIVDKIISQQARIYKFIQKRQAPSIYSRENEDTTTSSISLETTEEGNNEMDDTSSSSFSSSSSSSSLSSTTKDTTKDTTKKHGYRRNKTQKIKHKK